MKIALVHDWLRVNAGSEKVVSEILSIYESEEVDIYTLFDYLPEEDRAEILHGKAPKTSLLQHFPTVSKNYRFLLPLMPALIRSFYLKGYDFIISSSHAVAKGFRRDKDIPHICYCHTPMRYAWDLYEDYSNDSHSVKAMLYKSVVRHIRNWDYRSSKNVDFYIANSENVRQRIKKNYGRDATVIYPPVRVEQFQLSDEPRGNFYLCLGRFVPYKKIDMVIRAFRRMPEHKLLLIGGGYGSPKISRLLQDVPNITWLGYKNDEELVRYMQKAKACIYAAKEDFGIMCVETQACGTPVLALNNGGYKETVVDGVSGYFFDEQNEESVIAAVKRFEAAPLEDHAAIRLNAERFSSGIFKEKIATFVKESLANFGKDRKAR